MTLLKLVNWVTVTSEPVLYLICWLISVSVFPFTLKKKWTWQKVEILSQLPLDLRFCHMHPDPLPIPCDHCSHLWIWSTVLSYAPPPILCDHNSTQKRVNHSNWHCQTRHRFLEVFIRRRKKIQKHRIMYGPHGRPWTHFQLTWHCFVEVLRRVWKSEVIFLLS